MLHNAGVALEELVGKDLCEEVPTHAAQAAVAVACESDKPARGIEILQVLCPRPRQPHSSLNIAILSRLLQRTSPPLLYLQQRTQTHKQVRGANEVVSARGA